jgi:hypothetical protein
MVLQGSLSPNVARLEKASLYTGRHTQRFPGFVRHHWLRTSRSASLTRLCALALVVLATLPFTAPFAAIDIADLFGSERPRAVAAVVSASAVGNPS